jgi:rhodanese-related sulfurtransferase
MLTVCAHTSFPPTPPQVQRKFPDRGAKLLVACSNGRQYSIDALEKLDEAGYTNIVGLRGGYTAWFRCATQHSACTTCTSE